ncbi:hypothetical protein P3T23_004915 [Paraburkholderia sp. GAS448]
MEDITHALPDVITAHIAAHNRPDPNAFIETFSNDQATGYCNAFVFSPFLPIQVVHIDNLCAVSSCHS